MSSAEYQKKWRENHPGYHRDYQRKWRENHPSYHRDYKRWLRANEGLEAKMKRSIMSKEKYLNDPEYRAKKLACLKAWRQRKKEQKSLEL